MAEAKKAGYCRSDCGQAQAGSAVKLALPIKASSHRRRPTVMLKWKSCCSGPKKRGETPFLLLLDEIEDPHNLGSILRTAECTGVHGVIIPKRRSAGLTRDGMENFGRSGRACSCSRVTNLAQTIEGSSRRAFGSPARTWAPSRMCIKITSNAACVVIGNEAKGMGAFIREKCDFLVKLPMLRTT